MAELRTPGLDTTYWKVRTIGSMASDNIARTCEMHDLLVPCYHHANRFKHEGCEATEDDLGFEVPHVLSESVCQHETPEDCPSLDDTFSYTVNVNDTGSCGVYNGSLMCNGKSLNDLWAICASKQSKTWVYDIFLLRKYKNNGRNENHKYQYWSFCIKIPAFTWYGYGSGKTGCTGEGEALPDNVKPIRSLNECRRSCDDTSNCNAVAWNSIHDVCHLKYKADACNDEPCDWDLSNATEWSFYFKNCGKYSRSPFCIYNAGFDSYYSEMYKNE